MKNVSLIVLVMYLSTYTALKAQTCVIPTALESTTIIPSNFYLEDETEGGFSSYGNLSYYDPNDVHYWNLVCDANPVGFTFWARKNVFTKVQMYCEIIGQKFNCDGTLDGPEFIAHTTPTMEYTGSSKSDMYVNFSFNVDPNTYYRVKYTSRHKPFGIWSSWVSEESQSIAFGEPLSAPNPDGYFYDELSVEPRTSAGTLWTVDVHQLDVDANFFFNAGPTTCEDKWHYEISEFNLDSWSATNTVSSPWIEGNAGLINMGSFYSAYGFSRGKLYMLKLVAGNGWYEKFFWFEIKDATLAGTIPNHASYTDATLEDGVITYHNVFLVCEGNPVHFVTTGTESVDLYRVRVGPVNGDYDLTGAEASTGILNAPVPGSINIESLYGSTLTTGQMYRVVYEITEPGNTALYYVTKVDCSGGGDPGHDDVRGRIANKNDKILQQEKPFVMYPNPVEDLVTITINDEKSEFASIEVLNQLGQVSTIGKFAISNGKVKVNLSHLPSDLYYLRINVEDRVSLLKFLKR